MHACLRKARRGIKKYMNVVVHQYLQQSTKEETRTMQGYFSKCEWRFFKFLTSNKCDAQTTAKAFYRAPAVWSSVETFVTQGTLHNYFEFCIFLLASVQAGLTDAWATGNQLLFLSRPLNHIAKNPQLGKKKQKQTKNIKLKNNPIFEQGVKQNYPNLRKVRD